MSSRGSRRTLRATPALTEDNVEYRSPLPEFCHLKMLLGLVLGGQLLACIMVLAADWSAGPLWDRLSLVSLYVQWIVLFSAGLLCLAQPAFQRAGAMAAGIAAWLLVQAVTALVAQLAYLLAEQYGILPYVYIDGRWSLLLRSLGISAIVAALVLRYLYLDVQWRRQTVARSEARFQALQARIRPHFLFNSMNTVASLTRTDPLQAERVVEDLSDLFRASLSDPEGGSSLARELDLAQRYLAVEQLRLGERVRIEWDLEPLPEDARLPLLVLQPLLENAVYHGIEPSATKGVIRIAGRFRERRVNLSIRNSVPATVDSGERRQSNRMALDNVRQRLLAMYPDRASLTIGRVEGEFQVRLVFPYP
jgi:two-component system sensor histidine kinase AlgZ